MKKKSIKLLVALSMLQGLAGKAYAHEMVVVNDSHGGTSTFSLSAHPVISIDAYSLILKTDDATVMYPLNEFVTFSIVDDVTTGVQENNVSSPAFSFGSGLRACGLQPSAPVRIYNLSGVLVAEGYADAEDKVTDKAVDSIRSFVGYQKIYLDAEGQLSKADPRIQLDASSIAKGYMCDIVGDWLKGKGIENYMVEIGGEVTLLGSNPTGVEWGVGINVPQEDALQRVNGILNTLRLTSGGVATSGNYRNFYYRDGKRYAHTIDPRTGYPVQQDILSSTVIAPDCLTADAYATAFMVMGLEKAMDVLAKNSSLKAYFIVADENSRDGYKVVNLTGHSL